MKLSDIYWSREFHRNNAPIGLTVHTIFMNIEVRDDHLLPNDLTVLGYIHINSYTPYAIPDNLFCHKLSIKDKITGEYHVFYNLDDIDAYKHAPASYRLCKNVGKNGLF